MICIQVSQNTPTLQVKYTLNYRHFRINVLNPAIFTVILEVFYVSHLEDTEEYADFLLFLEKKKCLKRI